MKNLWINIKCFFGFCTGKEEKKLRERLAVEAAYKKDPIVVEIKKDVKKPTYKKDPIVVEIKKDVKKADKKIKKDNGDNKRDWSWYNNSKTNLRIYENETIPEGYVKGMKPKKKKGDK